MATRTSAATRLSRTIRPAYPSHRCRCVSTLYIAICLLDSCPISPPHRSWNDQISSYTVSLRECITYRSALFATVSRGLKAYNSLLAHGRLHQYLTLNPYIFVPFNAIPRIYLGQQFAYNEASYYIIRLLQRYPIQELDRDSRNDEREG